MKKQYAKDTWQDIIKRVLLVIREINSGTYPNLEYLANKTNVHKRTIRRVIAGLKKDFNAPIKSSRKHGGYYFEGGKWNL